MVTKYGRTPYEQKLEDENLKLKQQIKTLRKLAKRSKKEKPKSFFGEVKEAAGSGGSVLKKGFKKYKQRKAPLQKFLKSKSEADKAERRAKLIGVTQKEEQKFQRETSKSETAKKQLRLIQDRDYKGKSKRKRFGQAIRKTFRR